MSTDGPGLIDGDTAFDAYNDIMDQYDSGVEFADIIERAVAEREQLRFDAFEDELYMVAVTQALWEIGHLPDAVLADVTEVIESERGLREWEETDEAMAQQRKRILTRFLKKIQTPRAKPRPRRKSATVKRLAAGIGDCFLKTMVDGGLACIIVLNIDQRRGHCSYRFGLVHCENDQFDFSKPLREHLILARKVSTHHSMARQGWTWGLTTLSLEHKVLVSISSRLTNVGRMSIGHGAANPGTYMRARSESELDQQYSFAMEHVRGHQPHASAGVSTAEANAVVFPQLTPDMNFEEMMRVIAMYSDQKDELVPMHVVLS